MRKIWRPVWNWQTCSSSGAHSFQPWLMGSGTCFWDGARRRSDKLLQAAAMANGICWGRRREWMGVVMLEGGPRTNFCSSQRFSFAWTRGWSMGWTRGWSMGYGGCMAVGGVPQLFSIFFYISGTCSLLHSTWTISGWPQITPICMRQLATPTSVEGRCEYHVYKILMIWIWKFSKVLKCKILWIIWGIFTMVKILRILARFLCIKIRLHIVLLAPCFVSKVWVT